jgi:hypothetical protein
MYGRSVIESIRRRQTRSTTYNHTRRSHHDYWRHPANGSRRLRNDASSPSHYRSRKRSLNINSPSLSIRMRPTPPSRTTGLIRGLSNHIRNHDCILVKRRILLCNRISFLEIPNRFPNRFRNHHDCVYVRFPITRITPLVGCERKACGGTRCSCCAGGEERG